MKEEHIPQLHQHPSYLKINRKKHRDRYLLTEMPRTKEEGIPSTSTLQACGSGLLYKTEPSRESKGRNESNSLLKKYTQTRSKEKEIIMMRGATPYQNRKLAQKSKTTKTLSRILQNSKTEQTVENSHKNWFIVRQITQPAPQCEQKYKEDIRQTDVTLKDIRQSSHLRKSQNNCMDESRVLLNSWLFPSANEQLMAKNAKEQLKNKKMTLKQLWRAKNNMQITGQSAPQQISTQNLRKECKDKMKAILMQNEIKKNRSFFQARAEELMPKQSSIHSKNTKNKPNYYQYPIDSSQSALKIKVCVIENNTTAHDRKESIGNSNSEPKIECPKVPYRRSPKFRSNFSLKKIKTTEEAGSKMSGWEYINDYTEREQLF